MISRILNFFRISKNLAIDLGTANVLVYDANKEKIVIDEPSVIVKDKKTNEIIAVGSEAREMIGKNPEVLNVIKPLKEGVISDLDAARDMLNAFIKKAYGISPFKPTVMLCVPIEVTSVERRALFDAVVGAKKTYIIEEGRAAIIGSGIDISKPQGRMVIDIGGGSTDIAVISLNEIVVSKSLRIAGNTLDNDIIRYIKDNIKLAVGERTVEKIKQELSTAIMLDDENNKEIPIKGIDLISRTPKQKSITSNQICEAILPTINKIISGTKEVLSECPPEIATDILENGITLTGGGANIRNLDKLIEKTVNIPVIIANKPLESVVVGAGLALKNNELLKLLLMREN